MVVIKITPSLKLAGRSNAKLFEFCETLIENVPLVFTDTIPKISEFTTAANDFKAKTTAARYGTPSQKEARDLARVGIGNMITDLAWNCVAQSNGDLVKFLACGFEMKNPPTHGGETLDTPENIQFSNDIEKELEVSVNKVKRAVVYVFFIGETADNPDDYKLAGISTETKFIISGLQSGKRYYVRCYAVGKRKSLSQFSQVATKFCS